MSDGVICKCKQMKVIQSWCGLVGMDMHTRAQKICSRTAKVGGEIARNLNRIVNIFKDGGLQFFKCCFGIFFVTYWMRSQCLNFTDQPLHGRFMKSSLWFTRPLFRLILLSWNDF